MNKILGLIAILSLCACASEKTVEIQGYETYGYTSHTTYSSCDSCSSSYTVREPVEVIYKDVTYTTVYEPKTYQSVKYTRKPYDRCDTDLCK